MGRKSMVRDRGHLANVLTTLEGGKSESNIGDNRQFLKLLVKYDANATLQNKKSPLMMLRREAALLAAKMRKKAKRKKK